MAESLAVRYRPRRFADVAGQAHAIAVLRSAASRPNPPQQILLAGPSGLGKTTTARIFAAALLCEHRGVDGDACGLCESCLEITGPGGAHPDVVELDAASNGGKDEIRDLAARAVLHPLRARWKVYIIDEAHGLTGPGSQAFLRLLEEPPGHCVFVLATTDPGKLPVALQGRCLYLEVVPPDHAQLTANLARIAAGEDWALPVWVADAVVHASDPALGVRGTVTTLDKLTDILANGQDVTGHDVEHLLGVGDPGVFNALTVAILAGDRAQAVESFSRLDAGPGRVAVRRQLTSWARGLLLEAAATRSGVDAALYRYATIVEAPSFDGGLLLAVARATRPELAGTPEAAQALLEQARDVLCQLAATRTVAAPAGAATPDPAAPMATTEDSARPATRSLASGGAQPPAAVTPPAAGAGTAGDARELGSSDAELLALLNAVSHVHGPAAFVLRKCTVKLSGRTFLVDVPQALRARSESCDLPAVLTSAGEALGREVHVLA